MPTKNPFSSLHNETRQRVLQVLSDRVTAALESGERLTWNSLLAKSSSFVNVVTNRPYTGWTNVLLLIFTSMAVGGDTRFVTFPQLKGISPKARVKNGEKATPIFRPMTRLVERENENGEVEKDSVLVGWKVVNLFSVQQTNLIELGLLPKEWEQSVNSDPAPIESVEQFASRIPFNKVHSSGHPFYNPGTDEIGMPSFGRFHSNVAHAEGLCHELIHWTGHENRLDRNLASWTNQQDYSREELVACLGSAFLLAHLGVKIDDSQVRNAAAYMKGWLQPLSDDVELLVEAAAEASRSVNFLITLANGGKEKTDETETNHQMDTAVTSGDCVAAA